MVTGATVASRPGEPGYRRWLPSALTTGLVPLVTAGVGGATPGSAFAQVDNGRAGSSFASGDQAVSAVATTSPPPPWRTEPPGGWASPLWEYTKTYVYEIFAQPVRAVKALVTGEAGAALGERAVKIAENASGEEFTGTAGDWFRFGRAIGGDLTGINPAAEGIGGYDLATQEELPAAERVTRGATGLGTLAVLGASGASGASGLSRWKGVPRSAVAGGVAKAEGGAGAAAAAESEAESAVASGSAFESNVVDASPGEAEGFGSRVVEAGPESGGGLVSREVAGAGPATAAPKAVPQGLSEAQFNESASAIRAKAGHIEGEVVVQGSRAAGTAKATSDIDFAVRVSQEQFDALIKARFGNPNPGSAKFRTMQHAIETGKIQAGEAGLRPLRVELEGKLGIEVDISVIRKGGPFDNPPFIPLPE